MGRPDGQADAEMAQPPLLDHGLRAKALSARDHRLRQHARLRQDHLRRVLPVRGEHRTRLHRTRRPAAARPRLGTVPARQRHPGVRIERVTPPGTPTPPRWRADSMSRPADNGVDELREAVRAFLEKKSSNDSVRALMETESGVDRDVWTQAAVQLGIAGLLIPEHLGGSGAGMIEFGTVFEEAGRALWCAPLLST